MLLFFFFLKTEFPLKRAFFAIYCFFPVFLVHRSGKLYELSYVEEGRQTQRGKKYATVPEEAIVFPGCDES